MRPAVLREAAASGVPAELLTTHADLIPGLPDDPYGDVVCIRDGVAKDDPGRYAWEDYLWRKYRESRHAP